MDTEKIVLLNDDWQVIGEAPKLASHNANTPLHLAFSCFVFNTEGKMLMTQRALHKKVWPGFWTNSCCGHPAPGEAMVDAITRRLDYELGLQVSGLREVLPDFHYRCEDRGIVENECCPVYVAYADAEPKPNPEEVADYVWQNWDDVKQAIANDPEKYSYWCKLEIPLLEQAGIGQPHDQSSN